MFTQGEKRISRFLRDERGAALVEMTLITPFMLVLAAGVFEFSGIMHTKLLVETGLRDGARYIARCYREDPPTACEAAGKSIAVNGVPSAGGTLIPRVNDWTVGQINVDYEVTAITVNEDGEQNLRSNTGFVRVVRVSTDYAYAGSGLWSYLGFDALTLSMAHEERVLGW